MDVIFLYGVTAPRNAKKETFFARIFDMTLHIIISGNTNDHRGIQGYRRRKGRGGGEERNRDREVQSDHMIREPDTPDGMIPHNSSVKRLQDWIPHVGF